MATERDERTAATPSAILRFLDAFLQDRNIKWILGVGVILLFGSSLMLVESNWERLEGFEKYAIFFGYTICIWICGEVLHRRGLTRTGTVLLALTVLLMPLNFVVLSFVERGIYFCIPVQLAMSHGMASRIFRHFLRARQTTFLVSYVLLCAAGLMAGLGSDPIPSTPTILALWAVFAAGTVKVNRHVFWLTEKHRLPRIFAFFPIALLGSQFVSLSCGFFMTDVISLVAPAFLGVISVLTSIPILFTADARARVFQQRSGDLLRPYDWSIVLPLGVGLIVCVLGVALSAASLFEPAPVPRELVIASALTAVVLGVVARRTRKVPFVWGMLAAMLIAYNFSPAFFLDLARRLVNVGAEAVREERLPYAFYGLTYLPVLVVGVLVSRARARRGDRLFATPIRWLVTGLSLFLLGLSLTHTKAVLPVSLVMVPVFALQARAFADRSALVAASLAWMLAALGAVPFLDGVLGVDLPAEARVWFGAGGALILSLLSGAVDRAIGRLPGDTPGAPERGIARCIPWFATDPLRRVGLVFSAVIASFWFVTGAGTGAAGNAAFFALLSALVLQTLLAAESRMAFLTIVFALVGTWVQGAGAGWSFDTMLAWNTGTLVALASLVPLLERRPGSRLSRTFLEAVYWAVPLLLFLLAGVFVPLLTLDCCPDSWFREGVTTVSTSDGLKLEMSWTRWGAAVLCIAWALTSAWRRGGTLQAFLGSAGVLAAVGSAFLALHGSERWLAVVLAGTALVAGEIVAWRLPFSAPGDEHAARRGPGALAGPLGLVSLLVLGTLSISSLFVLNGPMRIAGLIALVGLLRSNALVPAVGPVIANWQAVALVLQLVCGAESVAVIFRSALHASGAVLPLAGILALSSLGWQVHEFRGGSGGGVVTRAHRGLLRGLAFAALVASLFLHMKLDLLDVFLASSAFAALALGELWSACHWRREARVWSAQVIFSLGVGYFIHFGLIEFGHGVSMLVLTLAGMALWLLGRGAARRESTAVLAGPCTSTGLLLPGAGAVLGIARHGIALLSLEPTSWTVLKSFAVILAAAFYFWRGLEERNCKSLLAAAALVNFASLFLWIELGYSDPQFYMIPIGLTVIGIVQILREEVPARLLDPLRYLGALVVLVSPVFDIVNHGSWAHIFSLMVLSVLVALLAIGLKVRVLLYTGVAFLVADLTAMIVRGSLDNPDLLWISGITLGVLVLALGAFCEYRREEIQQRMRRLSAVLGAWD